MEMRSDLKLIDRSIDSLINLVNDIFIISSTFPLDLNVAVSGVKSPRSVFFEYSEVQLLRLSSNKNGSVHLRWKETAKLLQFSLVRVLLTETLA